eukprot:CAMPEP_0185755204 /NCGR_PEP_ID=MMETSP1174-20130828/13738_1 /TAXON_ID=35687 /ORGANISM="Dictyocha speculum, Strain CCMP1381" /LENGTH=137 /DNA_ID=CAMNT_0028433675 /DNA_START=105 /DNA_END=515 /DNA_ORIENTATION=+
MELEKMRPYWGYSHIELDITFAMDLYPHFPPQVKVVRPRFEGFLLGQIASMRELQLSHWSSVTTMRDILNAVKQTLSEHGRVQVASSRNDRVKYPDGAFTNLEHLLMRLGLLTEITPRIQSQATTIHDGHNGGDDND